MKAIKLTLKLALLFLCTKTVIAETPPSLAYWRSDCVTSEKIYESRTKELTELVTADQQERENWQTKTHEEMEKTTFWHPSLFGLQGKLLLCSTHRAFFS